MEADGKYLDGCLRTRGKCEHAQGYYVARVRFQKQPSHWSAFWVDNAPVGKVNDRGARRGRDRDFRYDETIPLFPGGAGRSWFHVACRYADDPSTRRGEG